VSDIIRDAIIRLHLELVKGGVDTSDLSGVTKAIEQQQSAVKKVGQEIEQNKRSAKEFATAMKAVPEDWGKLFKSKSEAQNFAYQQYGDRGQQYLKDDPEHIAYLKRMQDLQGGAGDKAEEFGRKTELSYQQAGRGALQLTRGLAMLATSSGEVTQKMLQNLIAIEGASQLVTGVAGLAKFSSGLDLLGKSALGATGLIAAGLGIATAYGAELEKETKRLEGLDQRYQKLREHGATLARQQESIKTTSTSVGADETSVEVDRIAKQAAQLAEIRNRRGELGSAASESESARLAARQQRESAESLIKKNELNTSGGRQFWDFLNSPSIWGPLGRKSQGDLLKEQRNRAAGRETAAGGEESGFIGSSIEQANRERDILQKQRDDAIRQEEERGKLREQALKDQMSSESPFDKSRNKMAKSMFDVRQFQIQQELENTGTTKATDFAYGRSFEQQQGLGIQNETAGNVQRIKQDTDKSLAIVADIIRSLSEQLARLKSELDAAHDN
jgi:hypothetical protein